MPKHTQLIEQFFDFFDSSARRPEVDSVLHEQFEFNRGAVEPGERDSFMQVVDMLNEMMGECEVTVEEVIPGGDAVFARASVDQTTVDQRWGPDGLTNKRTWQLVGIFRFEDGRIRDAQVTQPFKPNASD
ncbi:MAG: nuclear transport factor 2 family protein [Gemmatimonadetes bacterium]|nr:nuclear transport factor 2 family protein [Gemmatimonadota bacterium]